MTDERKAATNSTYPKGGVSCSKDSFVVNGTLVFQIKFCGKIPALRVAAKRCALILRSAHNQTIMKKGTFFILLAFLLINCSMTAEKEVIRPKFVFDYEQILTENQVDSLNTLFKNLEKETNYQIVLVTTHDYGKHKKNVEYAVEFGETHKVNGIVIVFSKAKREVFIATDYDMEYYLHDVLVKRIIDDFMVPKFREEDYFGGLYAGSKVIVDLLN